MTAATQIYQLRAMLPPGMRESIDEVHAEEEPKYRPKAAKGSKSIISYDFMVFDHLIRKLRSESPNA